MLIKTRERKYIRNFKYISFRGERDRERETDRETERDIQREKENKV